jgi:hypothetical protein
LDCLSGWETDDTISGRRKRKERSMESRSNRYWEVKGSITSRGEEKGAVSVQRHQRERQAADPRIAGPTKLTKAESNLPADRVG